ncbi:heavy-metal-associated domain-containing protein [Clostridium algidicarnis]|uniref:heavy-metal-associated domain-containing protein n=1 Tax=Clostridium algidicarnis TaxID=37659 RepID=UPI001C0DCA94|nr:heavy metal-associated domain-containing protein [Clostridium algidicarnis]MBU3228549.1 heavy-metal-associated domain-containing protein [Clostridium algidicarnis]MBU3251974.1 heavy-metal-associated domain-containing protein [Clostridium algidicarnis]
MKKIQYEVSGVMNSEGKTKIKNSLDKIQGVQEVQVDGGTGKVKVQYNEPATKGAIKSSILKQGFTLS